VYTTSKVCLDFQQKGIIYLVIFIFSEEFPRVLHHDQAELEDEQSNNHYDDDSEDFDVSNISKVRFSINFSNTWSKFWI
jgi:hypothetical protein